MTYTASITPNSVEQFKLTFDFFDSSLDTSGQVLTFANSSPIKGGVTFTVWHMSAEPANSLLNLSAEFRWSDDNATFSGWIAMDSTEPFRTVNAVDHENVYMQFRVTLTGNLSVALTSFTVEGNRTVTAGDSAVSLSAGESIVFKPTDVYKIFKLTGFELVANGISDANPLDAHIRYSQSQGRTWSEWILLTDENLKNLSLSKTRFTIFEVAVTAGPSGATLYDIELLGDFENISKNRLGTSKIGIRNVCIPSDDEGGDGTPQDCKDDPSAYDPCTNCEDDAPTFNPYEIGQLAGFYNYLNNTNSQIWGAEVDYFKTTPDENGEDTEVHEYQLYNGDIKPMSMKVLVPNNQYPDSTIKFNEFNLDLFESFEIHITKDAFKKVFGVEERPGQKDVILFCKLNRLYEVENVLHDRGAFNTSTYYRVILKKFTKDANVRWSDPETQQAINALTSNSSLESLFGDKNAVDRTNETKPKQYDTLSRNYTRVSMDKDVKLVDYQLQNATLTVAKSIYSIKQSLAGMPVNYGNVDSKLNAGDSRYVTMWFKLNDYNPLWTFNLLKNSSSSAGYDIKVSADALVFTVNGVAYAVPFVPETDVWYALIAGIDGTEHKIELYLYTRMSEMGDTLNSSALKTIAGKVWEDVKVTFNNSTPMFLGSVDVSAAQPVKRTQHNVTNVRVFTKSIDKRIRTKTLNALIEDDEAHTLLIDNAYDKIILPFMGNP